MTQHSLHKEDLVQMGPEYFESLDKPDLIHVANRLLETAVELWEQTHQDSHNSSKPPSSDSPYTPGETEPEKEADQEGNGHDDSNESPPCDTMSETLDADDDHREDGVSSEASGERRTSRGKQPGASGVWRSEPLNAEEVVSHTPDACAACGTDLRQSAQEKPDMGYYVLELEQTTSGLRVVCRLHHYYSASCPHCGHLTTVRPGKGAVSSVEGRKKDLQLQEYVLVGPLFVTFIASLSVRYRMSRVKIREFLGDWFQTPLSTGTIDRCVREAGIACTPVVEQLLDELQAAEILHVDETPWYESGHLVWLWVVISVTAQIAVYRVGSRKKEVFLELVTEAFLGWLISDGYRAYRSHPKRQRCLAHVIRKAISLAEGVDEDAAQFGTWLLKELRGLIQTIADGGENATRRCYPILARLKRACLLGADGPTQKMRASAREILNDWEAFVAFVKNPDVPPTNNEAERALRHAVISRRISHGTRTSEGSRAYSALLSVIETCRLRKLNPWTYIAEVIALARKGMTPLPVPVGVTA
jgi:transposase